MGYMRHHAIVVSCYDMELTKAAYAWALEVFPVVSPILESRVNHYASFFIPPDGSKEGWSESADGDLERAKFITWLRSKASSDGSSPYGWVEVQYDDDNKETTVTRSSDHDYQETNDGERNDAGSSETAATEGYSGASQE